ncbi:MAG: hypothetical protein IT378_19125 [Sandaracinaceae bacterium]|nr:hypothetical protein [Sandaracinaceae bacterium]
MRIVLALALLGCLSGCGSPDGITCGRGTVRVGRECVAPVVGSDAGPPLAGSDASVLPPLPDAGPPPPPRVDAGWTLTPPGTPPPPPGCDEAEGECELWQEQLRAQIAMFPGRCTSALAIDPATQYVAERHARRQADADRVSVPSPEGDLFAQVRAAGTSVADGAALFASTRDGPADVLARWGADPASAAILRGCYDASGIAFKTSPTETSYVTVILVRR